MPDLSLQINAPIEPLSPKAKEGLGEFLMCDSQAYYSLYRELSEYVEGRISGRSILVSGHRGSGKTTLVHRAIVEIKEGLIRNKSNHRLLLVNIHGPSLFETSDGKIIKKKNPVSGQLGRNEENKRGNDKSNGNENEGNRNGNNDSNVNKESERKVDASSDNNIFLEQITVALYKAYATEIIEKFKELKNSNNEVDDRLIARLALDLQNAASHSELGLFWRKTNLLNDENNNGFNELLALASVSQAYRTIVGDLNLTITNEDDNSIEGKQNAEFKSKNFFEKFKPIATEIWSLLAGSAVFTGVLIDEATYDFKGLIAALAAIVTAFFTNFTLSLTINRSRKSTFKKEFTFIRDKKAETLSREIPVLIERLKGAGCYPVFVVDELDKIVNDTDGAKAFRELISEAKHLIADRSFFCFLTDRNYYDYLSEVFKKESYPIEHTLFSSRFFIAYGPQFLHDYLVRLFEEDLKKYFDVTKGIQDKEKLAQIYCFFFCSLYKSRFHVGDLNQSLFSSISKSSSNDSGSSYEVIISNRIAKAESAYAIQITIQLAIEYMILGYDKGSLKIRLDQEPSFSQIVFDTLYYPSRHWEMGDRRLSIVDSDFRNYLKGRVQQINDVVNLTDDKVGGQIKEKDETDENDPFISDIDFGYLYNLLTELVGYLQNTNKLIEALKPPYEPQYDYAGLKKIWVSNIIELIPEQGLLKWIEDKKLSWNYDYFGRELKAELTPDQEAIVFLIIDQVDALNSFTEKLSGGIVKNLVSEPLPSQKEQTNSLHKNFFDALDKIRNYRRTSRWYDDIIENQKLLESYKHRIDHAYSIIKSLSFLSSLSVGHLKNNKKIFTNFFVFLMRQLGINSFLDLNSDTWASNSIELDLRDLGVKLDDNSYKTLNDWLGFELWKVEYETLIAKKNNTEELPLSKKETLNNYFWDVWFDRFSDTLKANQKDHFYVLNPIDLIFYEFVTESNIDEPISFQPKFDFALLKEPNPSNDFSHNLDQLTRYNWIKLFFDSFLEKDRTDEHYIPFWISVVAMLWLGLYRGLRNMDNYLERRLKKDGANFSGEIDLFDRSVTDEEHLENYTPDPTASNHDNGKLAELFKAKDLLKNVFNERILDDKKINESSIVLLIQSSDDKFLDVQDRGIRDFSGLLEVSVKNLETLSPILEDFFKQEDFTEIIHFGSYKFHEDIKEKLPEDYSIKFKTIVPGDSDSENHRSLKNVLVDVENNSISDFMSRQQLQHQIKKKLSNVQFFKKM